MQLLVYEIPYINSPALGLISLNTLESKIPKDFECNFKVVGKKSVYF